LLTNNVKTTDKVQCLLSSYKYLKFVNTLGDSATLNNNNLILSNSISNGGIYLIISTNSLPKGTSNTTLTLKIVDSNNTKVL